MESLIARLLSDFEAGKMNRRQLIQSLAFAATAASAAPAASAAAAPGKGFKTVEVNHISYTTTDYRVTRDFYADLMGMTVAVDDWRGRGEAVLTWGRGPSSYLIVRNRRAPQGQTAESDNKPVIDHIAYTIENWDKNAVEAELKGRGLEPRPDTDDSFHVKDPNGYDLQICGPGLNVNSAAYKPPKK
jgi:catechol 2,3-dioxygenase-like lactoylglutathione lyase family enzyme